MLAGLSVMAVMRRRMRMRMRMPVSVLLRRRQGCGRRAADPPGQRVRGAHERLEVPARDAVAVHRVDDLGAQRDRSVLGRAAVTGGERGGDRVGLLRPCLCERVRQLRRRLGRRRGAGCAAAPHRSEHRQHDAEHRETRPAPPRPSADTGRGREPHVRHLIPDGSAEGTSFTWCTTCPEEPGPHAAHSPTASRAASASGRPASRISACVRATSYSTRR
jgi:hypothetical protein